MCSFNQLRRPRDQRARKHDAQLLGDFQVEHELNKVTEAAKFLQVDPVFLLSKVLAENDADLWDVIDSVMGDRPVIANEMALIELVRKGLEGHDINLAENTEFTHAVIVSLTKIGEQQNALNNAALVATSGSASRTNAPGRTDKPATIN